ncbi:hypothetical protein ACHAW5_005853 [Stephanodiscus triporus]|uniref:GOLD domain-containing protein n=1 Tax=Stephanodiscus triporus TaxID=2934178 RepID=A0ABD3MWZ3_9STRA
MPTTEEKDPATSAADGDSSSSANGNDDDDDDDPAELEARAIAQAMQSADAAYVPSPSVLASDDPAPLLSQVDGPSLVDFKSVPSVYQGKSVPVALRSRFDVPIHVGAGGSVVEYHISTEAYDIAFGVTAEREEGVTNVKETTRVDSHLEPVTGKFLVGSVPCALVFSFDNEYSWFREKKVTYRIVVTPPRTENVVKGRRLRAKKALEVVEADGRELDGRHAAARTRRAEAKAEVERLEGELARWKKALDDVAAEEEWVGKRRIVRAEQVRMLNERLECGWEDERYEI